MKSKPQVIAGWVVSGLAGIMIIISGIMKWVGPPELVDGLTKLGVGAYIPVLGTMEIIFAALFLFPRTIKIGFILLTCYFSGAIATDLSHGNSIMNAAMPLTITWIGAYIRRSDIFVDSKIS